MIHIRARPALFRPPKSSRKPPPCTKWDQWPCPEASPAAMSPAIRTTLATVRTFWTRDPNSIPRAWIGREQEDDETGQGLPDEGRFRAGEARERPS